MSLLLAVQGGAPAGRSGSLAATETGSDTLSGTGSAPNLAEIIGTMAAQEQGTDTFAATNVDAAPPSVVTGGSPRFHPQWQPAHAFSSPGNFHHPRPRRRRDADMLVL